MLTFVKSVLSIDAVEVLRLLLGYMPTFDDIDLCAD